MPLHTISSAKGQSDDAVKAALDQVCQALTDRGLVVKYFCSDGDPGYHDRHKQFFASWIDIFLDDGLEAALNHARGIPMIPVGDFLHLWKNYCNRVKSHPVTLSPDSVEGAVKGEDLEAPLGLGGLLQTNRQSGKCETLMHCHYFLSKTASSVYQKEAMRRSSCIFCPGFSKKKRCAAKL
jgi:hypothetical protein